jgi:hypothetical protein
LSCESSDEKHFDETFHVENVIHIEAPHEDETLVFSPLSNEDEVIQASIPHAHEEEKVVSFTPFQVFDVASFHDLETQEVLEESLDALNPSCYNKGDDVIDNIDDFMHVGKQR